MALISLYFSNRAVLYQSLAKFTFLYQVPSLTLSYVDINLKCIVKNNKLIA